MKRFLSSNLTKLAMVAIINGYEELRGATECESVFDLNDASDRNAFESIYGYQTRARCASIAR